MCILIALSALRAGPMERGILGLSPDEPMNAESRRKVLWLGNQPPKELRDELFSRGGLQLIPARKRGLLVQVPDSRALVIEFSGNAARFRENVSFARRALLDHGLSVAIMTSPSADGVQFQHLLEKMNFVGQQSIRVFYTKWDEAAQWIAASDPGPGLNSRLRISGDTIPSSHKFLLRRAFGDFPSIEVRKLKGGLSGAAAYVISPRPSESSQMQRRLPYLAKIDTPERVRGEHAKFLHPLWSLPCLTGLFVGGGYPPFNANSRSVNSTNRSES
jgi:hypothetical protein